MCEYGGIIKIKELFDLSTRNSRYRGISREFGNLVISASFARSNDDMG